MKETIITIVKDLCQDFVHYDRRNCEDLSRKQLQSAIDDGTITIEEILETIRIELKHELA